mmetsp:Transcript_6505/g.19751  ORF Transcript_6505/g.19751 Transcript_6505/m.19751 type:complete len:385 (+) Transcript_6505:203-1357(+)|eukprot:CAMPEP_0198735482 /NCGR_PEP_ID=MMETSP1475-20131203/59871_1 /TAXON_ID= ORGANISM="Unidentified sp., Strain CCMP1999" /NCGR_SAMPLE_ID=MMETSP1475 /ASSEMBLY_ACC=CAM_ASM_001111 /LENGTH=384 /DNA_ID=CAMNT_0044499157 /DNA_START=95 /DNA_END=1249 /DNA_ORIENTATION=+
MTNGKTYPCEVGSYLITDVIATGYYAEVRKAVHTDSGKNFAVKIFDLRSRHHTDLLSIVKNEVFVLRILRHANVVKVHEHVRIDKTSYMFMDLAPGKDLVAYLADNDAFEEAHFQGPFRKIVKTVVHLHGRGIYHGDLKPENIIVDENDTVTIVDFGTSQRRGSEKEPKSGNLCGTPHYLPPECVTKSEWRLDCLDIWSLGVLLFVCLTGTHPFAGDNKDQVFAAVIRNDITYPDYLSSSAIDLMKKMLTYCPAKRISLQEVLEHPFLAEENISTITETSCTPRTRSNLTDRDETAPKSIRTDSMARTRTQSTKQLHQIVKRVPSNLLRTESGAAAYNRCNSDICREPRAPSLLKSAANRPIHELFRSHKTAQRANRPELQCER